MVSECNRAKAVLYCVKQNNHNGEENDNKIIYGNQGDNIFVLAETVVQEELFYRNLIPEIPHDLLLGLC